MTVVPGALMADTDPLIRRAERFALGEGVPAWQHMAEFALGLVMGAENIEIDPTKNHPEAFTLGARCSHVLSMRLPQDELSAQVDAYLDRNLGVIQASLGDNWQWQDAFPAADRLGLTE